MGEGGTSGRDVGRVSGLVDGSFRVRVVLFWDDVINGLFH